MNAMRVDMRPDGISYPGRSYRFSVAAEPPVYEFGYGLVSHSGRLIVRIA